MSSLYICNTSSDCISEVNLNEFEEKGKILLGNDNLDRIGPHGICKYNDKLIIANNYSNDISIVNILERKVVSSHFIGMHCNDVAVLGDKAYVICGESNSLAIFNLKNNKLIELIPCESMPHCIDIDKDKGLIVVANMQTDSITIYNSVNMEIVKNIKVGAYPTKAIFSGDGNHVFVCESNLGMDSKGSIAIVSLKNYQIVHRITVGSSPVDMYCDQRFCLVSNFGEGSISIIYNDYMREINRLNVGGMPRGIIKRGKHIYFCDNYNNLLIEADIASENKKVISIGGEPTGMTLI